MSAASDAPRSSPDEKVPSSVSLDKQQTVDGHWDTKVEALKESSPTVFVNTEPIRAEQVENAVKFLSHPKVQGSPVIYRRSFLERKGLTKEEIDEAFRLVPDPSPGATTNEGVITNPDGQMNSSSDALRNVPTQIMQPTQILPVGTISAAGMRSQFHWSHAIMAVGFLAVYGIGSVVFFKKTILPKLKSWVHKVVLEGKEGLVQKNIAKSSPAEEISAAAKAASAAAADASRLSQEMMILKEKNSFEEVLGLLNVQIQEMKSMSMALRKFECGQGSIIRRLVAEEQNESWEVEHTILKQPYVNGNADADSRPAISLSPPTPAQPSAAPDSKSYMEILEMIQRGEKPSNIREINDAPPNPNQPLSNPRLTPKPKPWEINQTYNSTVSILSTGVRSNGSSYQLVEKQSMEQNAAPWWQSNVKITEIEADDEKKLGYPNELSIGQSQPPTPVVMPESDSALMQPKKPLADDQLLVQSPHVTNESGNSIMKHE